MRRLFTAIAILALGGAATAFVVNDTLSGGIWEPAANTDAVLRPAFALPDLEGKTRPIEDWDGRVVLLNFWAPWCPPCRREIPALVDLQNRYGDAELTVIGVTIDTHQNAEDFVTTYGVNYPVLVGEDRGIDIAADYGNKVGVLPYSVIIGRDGTIHGTHRAELSYNEAERLIKPLL